MTKLLDLFASQKRLWQQEQELQQLRKELSALRAQNDSMRVGMRRCVSCEYRIDFKQRQDETAEAASPPAPPAENKH
jgi:prefoldin subunit 5